MIDKCVSHSYLITSGLVFFFLSGQLLQTRFNGNCRYCDYTELQLFLFSFDELHLCKFIIIVFVFVFIKKKHSQKEQMWKSQQKWNRFTCSIHYQIMEPTNKQTNRTHAHTHIFFPGTSPISMIEELKENYFLSKQKINWKIHFNLFFFFLQKKFFFYK